MIPSHLNVSIKEILCKILTTATTTISFTSSALIPYTDLFFISISELSSLHVESVYVSVDFRLHDIYRSLAFEIADMVFIDSAADNRTGLKRS